ncbi:MAG: hypothetical protein ACF8PN_07365 [Phycisphaerales bacterium]
MRNRGSTSAILLLAMTLAVVIGCVERDEKITVRRDGSARIVATFQSDTSDDVRNEDAAPGAAAGWTIEERRPVGNDGKEKYQLIATREFLPGAELPDTFAAPGSAHADRMLRFPTRVTVERRPDGMYYHFYRRYEPRRWAPVGALKDIADEQSNPYLEQQSGGGALDAFQLRSLSEIQVRFAIERLETIAREAFVETNPQAPQDAWLAAHEALRDFRANIDYGALADLIRQAESGPEDDTFERLERQFEDAVLEALESALRASPGVSNLGGFRSEYASIKKGYGVTEDLADENFTIRVEMPGTIIASNAESSDGSTATWQFPGPLLFDRPIELMVTSRVGP